MRQPRSLNIQEYAVLNITTSGAEFCNDPEVGFYYNSERIIVILQDV